MFRKMRNREGFTLVELLVVIIIIGILAAIGFARLGQVTRSANIRADEADLRTLTSAVQMWALEEARTPEDKLGVSTGLDDWTGDAPDGEFWEYVEFGYDDTDGNNFPRLLRAGDVEWDGERWVWTQP